ncbi:hypothetical protein H5410_031206 [Solanum commersonii]|uniref:Uncharacterized protein n=1 Tax=Solanum commersonii TaxID=4109 RepID=A0A9J5YL05_SOLCO|nr:hypothetical protein H5410_031206 [Solanum commersonii]
MGRSRICVLGAYITFSGLISRSSIDNRHDESFRRAKMSEKHEVAKSTRRLTDSLLVRPLSAPLTPSAL